MHIFLLVPHNGGLGLKAVVYHPFQPVESFPGPGGHEVIAVHEQLQVPLGVEKMEVLYLPVVKPSPNRNLLTSSWKFFAASLVP